MSLAPRPKSLDFTLMSIKEEVRSGRWLERVPGEREMAARLGVSKNTVGAAYRRLVQEGWLVSRGRGRRLTLGETWLNAGKESPRTVRVLLNGPLGAEGEDGISDLLLRLRREVEQTGGRCEFCDKTQSKLGYDVAKIMRCLEAHADDLWILVSCERDLLAEVAGLRLRAFALAGPMTGIEIPGAGHDAKPWMEDLVGRLADMGHRRIVHVCTPNLLRPVRGRGATAFAETLAEKTGIAAGAYHQPDWDGEPEHFTPLLRELFRVTPPTALVLMHAYQVCAAYAFFCERGIRVPSGVSLAVMEDDPVFVGMQPAPAIMRKDWNGLRRIVLRWISKGGPSYAEFGQVFAPSKLLPGGTLAPAPTDRRP